MKRTTKTTAELRVFRDNPNVYESRSLNLSEVDDLVSVMEREGWENCGDDRKCIVAAIT